MILTSIHESIEMNWLSRKTTRSSSGWISGNAVCCEHNGETKDTRHRGGLKIDGESIRYHCFNCKYTASYIPGHTFSKKFLNLLSWLGFNNDEINKLRLLNLKTLVADKNGQPLKNIIPGELPLDSYLLVNVAEKYPKHVEYLQHRGFALTDYDFYVSEFKANQMRNRIILPLYRNQLLVGYTARSIIDTTVKYFTNHTTPVVFGINRQKYDWSWAIATEGPFDALSVDGLSFLGNEVSEEQASIIRLQGINPVIVPDNDKDGTLLIDAALKFGWPVSFPEWPKTIKDVNNAVQAYGKLFVLRHVWATTVHTPLQIKIKKKLLMQKYNN